MIILEKAIDSSPVNNKRRIPMVEAVNVGVNFVVGRKREDLQSYSYKLLNKRRRTEKKIWALKDVNFTGYAGDILGIVGSNGAGKTTLCRTIAGLLRPDTGQIHVFGSVTALFSLGTGFNQELTGLENIFLNGYMLGFSRDHIKQLLPQIVSFSGLGHFINEPLKRYSSGMRARLGFSIAAAVESDILVIDEAISAGDLEFRAKAAQTMQEQVAKASMVIVVSHQIDFIEENCTRALWIDRGRVMSSGKPGEVASAYRESIPAKARPRLVATRSEVLNSKVVDVKNLGLKYELTVKKSAFSGKAVFSRRKKPFWALRDVTFTINEGEIVGIIGPNGAGKTTLCRVLTGILKNDTGEVSVQGKTTALLSFGTGFNEQLTGRDNIFLNGLMLGIPKKKILQLYQDIVDFSELGKFIDRPVKHYSSGMKSRLGFSIAATIIPDILIIDEVLSAGDASFSEKASARIQELIGQAKAVIVVTHSLDLVDKLCTRAIWLNQGRLVFDGMPEETVARYKNKVL